MCIFPEVFCWHCEKKFTKQNDNTLYDFENCPYCKKGFNDLSLDAQRAVLMTLKPFEEET